jgi:hypothetical protein
MRRVRVTTVTVAKQLVLNILSVCLYSGLRYASSNRIFYAPYYAVICGLPRTNRFFKKLSHKWHDYQEKKVIEHKMCVLIFPTAFFSEKNSHCKKNSARYDHNVHMLPCNVHMLPCNVHMLPCNVPDILVRF